MRTKDEIRHYADTLGIDLVGFGPAAPLEASAFTAWLAAGHAAQMSWLTRRPEDRFDPTRLLPGAQSVISIGLSYFRGPSPFISRYAFGQDYHQVLHAKLAGLLSYLRQTDPGIEAKICVDSSPVAEKPLAQRAGLGWQGKHSLLVNPIFGSWIFLGELIINRAYPPDPPAPDRCGDCRKCLEACPTGAIQADRTIAAEKCLAYASIEYRGAEPADLRGCIFGCDLCQEACPWNTTPRPTREPAFQTANPLVQLSREQLAVLGPEEFLTLRRNTALAHISHAQFQRNIAWATRTATAQAEKPKTKAKTRSKAKI